MDTTMLSADSEQIRNAKKRLIQYRQEYRTVSLRLANWRRFGHMHDTLKWVEMGVLYWLDRIHDAQQELLLAQHIADEDRWLNPGFVPFGGPLAMVIE